MGVNITCTDTNGIREIFFNGSFDEDLEIDKVLSEIKPKMIFNLKDVNKITSFGVKLWIDLLKKIPDSYTISFEKCSIPFIDQTNMISNFVQKGTIKSYFAPFICENDHEFDGELTVGDVTYNDEEYIFPPIKCKQCGCGSELDEFADDYLSFLELENE